MTDAVEGHQCGGESEKDDQGARDALENAGLCDVLACQKVVLRIELEAPEIDDKPDMQGGEQGPTRDEHYAEDGGLPQCDSFIFGEWRNRPCERDSEQDNGEPRWTSRARHNRAAEEILPSDRALQYAVDDAVQP